MGRRTGGRGPGPGERGSLTPHVPRKGRGFSTRTDTGVDEEKVSGESLRPSRLSRRGKISGPLIPGP